MARLQQLACLDVSGPPLIESALHELHHLIGFDTGAYFYPAKDGGLDAYMEPSIARDLLHTYFDSAVQKSEKEVVRNSAHDFNAAVRREHGPQVLEQILSVTVGELLRSDFYNLALRPCDLFDCLSLVLRTSLGQGLGTLKLYRGVASPRFDRDDTAMLGRLEHLLARTLQTAQWDKHDSDVKARAMLVVTPNGRLLWTSPEANRLMALAFGPRWQQRTQLPHELQMLLQRLRFAFGNESSLCEAVLELPCLDLNNASGLFALRATRMAAAASEAKAVGIQITHRVPRVTLLLPALRALGLPPRQHELAYWLARGMPEAQIAERMGISENTATYHRRHIYAKLAVQTRQEMQNRLSAHQSAFV